MKTKNYKIVVPFLLWALFLGCVQEEKEGTSVDENGKFSIEKPVIPEQEFVITDYGAKSDGSFLNTEAINATILACSEAGGGKVIIPNGIWKTGPIQLKSHINLHVADGAVVLFTDDFDEYPFIQSYFEGIKDYRAMPLIYADSITDIAITGKGVFDGSGDAWRLVKKEKMTEDQWEELIESGGYLTENGKQWWPNKYVYEVSQNPGKYRTMLDTIQDRDKYKAYYRPYLVQMISCDRVLIEGPMFQNSPVWCIHPMMSTNLTINDIKIKNLWYAQNGDGIDVESCKYVSIRNSYFDVGDDAICIKSGRDEEGRERGMPTQYLYVDNCIVLRGHGGFVVGSEMSGGVKDVWVENCSFLGTDIGLRFKSARGRGGVVENIHIENIRMTNILRDAITFNLFYAGLAPDEMGDDPIEYLVAEKPEVTEETPAFKNITITGIQCYGADRAVQILGLPEMPVNTIKLSNSVFEANKGINCLFASGLEVDNVTVNTKGESTLNINNVVGANISSLKGNSELLCQIDGSETQNIKFMSEDIPSITEKIKKSEKVSDEEIILENL